MSKFEKTLKDRFWQALIQTFKRNDELENEFHFAALTNKLWRAEYLLAEKKVDVNSGQGFAIRFAVEGKHTDMIHLLIAHKADVNAKEGEALIRAAALGLTDIALDLIGAGANPSLRDGRALRLADAQNDTRMISAMLKYGRGLEKVTEELLAEARKQGGAEKVALYKNYLDMQAAKHMPVRPKLQGGPFNPKK
jgi:ankyrin repeat protein